MIFYFVLVLVGSFIAGRLILGELRKERKNYIAVSPHNFESVSKSAPERLSDVVGHQFLSLSESDLQIRERINKVEALLAEKNTELEKLQNLLEAERKYKVDFEKIKNLLEWQVFQSRQMNKEIKSQLDTLSIQGKEFQDEASRLKTELNYKQQVLAQSESKILELKNRLHGFLSTDASQASNPPQKAKSNPDEASFDEFDWRTKLEE